MSVRLEPIYLANVLLYIRSVEDLGPFFFVSKNCHEAMPMLKTNPLVTCRWPWQVPQIFPNVNTMIVDTLYHLDSIPFPSQTLTSIILGSFNLKSLPEQPLNYMDRVVEI